MFGEKLKILIVLTWLDIILIMQNILYNEKILFKVGVKD